MEILPHETQTQTQTLPKTTIVEGESDRINLFTLLATMFIGSYTYFELLVAATANDQSQIANQLALLSLCAGNIVSHSVIIVFLIYYYELSLPYTVGEEAKLWILHSQVTSAQISWHKWISSSPHSHPSYTASPPPQGKELYNLLRIHCQRII